VGLRSKTLNNRATWADLVVSSLLIEALSVDSRLNVERQMLSCLDFNRKVARIAGSCVVNILDRLLSKSFLSTLGVS